MIYFNALLILSIVLTIDCDPFHFRDCGPTDRYIKYNSMSITPYPVIYPGSVKFSLDLDVIKDIKGHIIMAIVMEKLTPKRMLIPCVSDLGSCTYDFCGKALKSFSQFFSSFGGKCPLTAGKYGSLSGSEVVLPSFGHAFDKVFEGNFEGNVTYYDADTKQVFGCAHIQFTMNLKSANLIFIE